MGFDRLEFSASQAIMFDQRAQLFNITNRWLPNQVNDQQPFAMEFVNDMTEANLPLRTGVMSPSAFADFGSSSPNRLPSVRSSSTDSFNDPDGPTMNNGNGNCQTPDFDDSTYEEHTLGTPYSFIEEQPQSPDSNFEQRQRLMSTSSTFTYSPYSPYDEGQMALGQAPALDRQTSLAIVEEVLGSAEECEQPLMFFPKDDSPLLETNEDSCLPPYPSPSFVEHFNTSSALADSFFTSSQDEEYFANYSGTADAPSGYQCDGSPPTESSPAANSNNNNCSGNEAQTSSTEETAVTCAEEAEPVQYLQPPSLVTTSAMERQNTNLSDILTSSMPQDSLDVHGMMQDFYNTLPPSQTLLTTVDPLALEPTPESFSNKGQLTTEQPSTSATPKPENCQLPQSHNNETDNTTVRRERNNAACRQSRKRRKEKKQELEHQAVSLVKENEQLKVKIEALEVECKRVRQSIFTVMTNNMDMDKRRSR